MKTSLRRSFGVGSLGHRLEWAAVPCGLWLAGLILRQTEHLAAAILIVTVSVGVLVAWIAVQDLKTFKISDSAIVTTAVLALAYRWSAAMFWGDSACEIVVTVGLDALMPGGLLLLFREFYYRRRGFDGLGLGDVKLAAAGGVLVGATGLSWALLAASLMGFAVFALSRYGSTDTKRGEMDKIAFGALLAPAIWAVWIVEKTTILLPYTDR